MAVADDVNGTWGVHSSYLAREKEKEEKRNEKVEISRDQDA